MSLRAKMLLAVGVTMAVMVALLFAVGYWRLTSEFSRLERDDARQAGERMRSVLAEETRRLEGVAQQMAVRNSTYEFLAGRHPDYVDTNLTGEILSNLDISFLVFVDEHGGLVHAEFVDLERSARAGVDTPTVEAVLAAAVLRRPGDPRAAASGFISTPSGYAVVASHASTTLDMSAPPRGTCIVGRFIDTSQLARLGGKLGLPLLVQAPADAERAGVKLVSGDTGPVRFVQAPVSEDTMGVWLSLPEVTGRGRVLLRAEQKRTIRQQGTGALAYLGGSLLALGLAAGASVSLMMDRGLFSRLARLSAELGTVASRRDPKFRVWESGRDELAVVAREVNATLIALDEVEDELEASRSELERRIEERTAELSASEHRYRQLVEGMADGVVSLDLEGRVTFVTERMCMLAGLDPATAVGASLYDVMTAASEDEVRRRLESGEKGEPAWTAGVEFVGRDRAVVPVELRASALTDERGALTGVQLIAHDVSERRRQERQLVHLASHDHLTGLHNRRFFETATEVALAEVRRGGGTGAVLWLDIDDFKDVNDTFGHRVGDEVLLAISEQLRKQVRESNVLARMGGDEFAILVRDVDAQQARSAGSRILAAMNSMTYSCAGHRIRVSASMGIVLFPEHGSTVQELLSSADLAMYDAKARGRSRLHVFCPEDRREADVRARVLWNERITDALRREQFVLLAQPVLDTRSDSVVRHELLIRMIDDDGELVCPAEFLPTAERLGLIRDIDRWVVRRAIELLRIHSSVGFGLEVNLSGTALDDAELLEDVSRLVAEAGIPPSRLGFEITETAAIADIARAQHFIGTLSEIGCRFSLDDFGSGFSSFYYLKHLPIDCLKVDGSYIRGLPFNKQDQHLVRGIVELCRALRIEVAAEYVETADVMREVRDLGIDYAQGYHIGRPARLEDAMRTMAGEGGVEEAEWT